MDNKIELYYKLVTKHPQVEIKGKTNPYTSANGYMFSQLNKDGKLGIRFPKEVQRKYMKVFGTGYFYSYGRKIKDFVLIPENIWDCPDLISSYLNESYNYVIALEPK